MTTKPPEPVVDLGDDDLPQRDTHPHRYPTIPVTVEGIVRTRVLSARRVTFNNIPVPIGGVPVRVLNRSDQRQTVLFSVSGAPVYFFEAQPPIGSTAGFLWPVNLVMALDYTGELWAVNNHATDGALISWALPMVEE